MLTRMNRKKLDKDTQDEQDFNPLLSFLRRRESMRNNRLSMGNKGTVYLFL